MPESLDTPINFSVWNTLNLLLFPASGYFLGFYTLDFSLQNKIERDTTSPLENPMASHEYTKAESTLAQHSGENEECLSLSCIQLFATPWTVARQAPLSMGFPKQEY